MKRDGVGLLVSICSLAEQRGSRGSINLNLSLSHNLNPAHLVFHFGLDVKNPGTPEPRIYIFYFLLSKK